VTGKLFLDREPRTPYLLKKTKESPAERSQLSVFLKHQLDTLEFATGAKEDAA
jgi:hypothetical protein